MNTPPKTAKWTITRELGGYWIAQIDGIDVSRPCESMAEAYDYMHALAALNEWDLIKGEK